MVYNLKNNKGQTSLEYLLLLVAAFITAYILVSGPFGNLTVGMFRTIISGLQNMVTNAEFNGEHPSFDQAGHPSSEKRLKPLHL